MLLYVLGSHGEMGAQDGMRGDEAATIYRSGSPLRGSDLKAQDVLAITHVPIGARSIDTQSTEMYGPSRSASGIMPVGPKQSAAMMGWTAPLSSGAG